MKWTIFGAGNFILDIMDAIVANGDQVSSIVANQSLDQGVLQKLPTVIKIVQLADFQPARQRYFCGFLDSHKEPLLKQLAPFHLNFANLIHPRAYVAEGVTMGQGNFVGANAVVGPAVQLGNFNTINRLASLGHDVQVGDGNHVGPGCTVAGRCHIGNGNLLGAGSTVIDGRQVGDGIILGAGGVLVQNALQAGTYVGVPAQRI
jgi:sugar O-acyltransferase (sialic acid O-acetyltransferase NeuD family)